MGVKSTVKMTREAAERRYAKLCAKYTQPTADRLFYYAAMVSKYEPPNNISSVVTGWRLANGEDEARGSAFEAAQQLKPGYSVDQIVIGEIPHDVFSCPARLSNTELEDALERMNDQDHDGEGFDNYLIVDS